MHSNELYIYIYITGCLEINSIQGTVVQLYISCGIRATNQSGMHFRTLENERRTKKIILITYRQVKSPSGLTIGIFYES